ncbi:MAG: DUF2220 domain-containing protein [Treponema sp.]|jgi:hypothetical protein|nr:DUF2220 domain-containing protein [Treponema sp.]
MTAWEQRIVKAFIERYPDSTAAKGGRPLKVKAEVIFPHFGSAPPPERKSFLEAAEALERRKTDAHEKLISIQWARKRKGEEIDAIVFEQPEALFALTRKESPALTAAEARETALGAAKRMAGAQIAEFFSFLAENIDCVGAVRGMDTQAVHDLEQLYTFHGEGENNLKGMTPRAVSVFLFNDSKRLETILKLFGRLRGKASRENIFVPDLSFLDRSFPEAWIAGKISLVFKDTSQAGSGKRKREMPQKHGPEGRLDNSSGIIIGLPFSDILKIEQINVVKPETSDFSPLPLLPPLSQEGDPAVLMVENKETFYTLAERFTGKNSYKALLYTGGYPNRAVQTLVALLAESGFSLYHAGDLDIDGILILQELAKAAVKPIQPVKMDRSTFDRYEHCGRKLDDTMLKYSSRINETSLSIPGIAELVDRIQETKLGIEQEIIDYGHI